MDSIHTPLPDSFDERMPAPLPPVNTRPLFWTVLILLLGIGAVLYFVTPRFIEVYDEVDVAMPTPTVIVGHLTDVVCQFPLVWILGSLLLAKVVARLPRTRRQVRVVTILCLVGVAGNHVLIICGLFMPLLCIHQGIAG